MFIYTIVVIAIVLMSSVALIYVLNRNHLLNIRTIVAIALSSITISLVVPYLFGYLLGSELFSQFGIGILLALVIGFVVYVLLIFLFTILVSSLISEKKAQKIWDNVVKGGLGKTAGKVLGTVAALFRRNKGTALEEPAANLTLDQVEVTAAEMVEIRQDQSEPVQETGLNIVEEALTEEVLEERKSVETVLEPESGENIFEKSVDSEENIDTMGIETVTTAEVREFSDLQEAEAASVVQEPFETEADYYSGEVSAVSPEEVREETAEVISEELDQEVQETVLDTVSETLAAEAEEEILEEMFTEIAPDEPVEEFELVPEEVSVDVMEELPDEGSAETLAEIAAEEILEELPVEITEELPESTIEIVPEVELEAASANESLGELIDEGIEVIPEASDEVVSEEIQVDVSEEILEEVTEAAVDDVEDVPDEMLEQVIEETVPEEALDVEVAETLVDLPEEVTEFVMEETPVEEQDAIAEEVAAAVIEKIVEIPQMLSDGTEFDSLEIPVTIPETGDLKTEEVIDNIEEQKHVELNADAGVDDYIEEAFRLKGNGDLEGAILHYMYALDKSPAKDAVFWIILDTCVLYKELGQAELAKDILESYVSSYGDVMDLAVKSEIERNLVNT